jgi:hypothetical protein
MLHKTGPDMHAPYTGAMISGQVECLHLRPAMLDRFYGFGLGHASIGRRKGPFKHNPSSTVCKTRIWNGVLYVYVFSLVCRRAVFAIMVVLLGAAVGFGASLGAGKRRVHVQQEVRPFIVPPETRAGMQNNRHT